MARRSRRLQSQQEEVLAENVDFIAAIHAEYSAKAELPEATKVQCKSSKGAKAKAQLSDRTNRRAEARKTDTKTASVFEFEEDDRVTPRNSRKAKTSKRSRAAAADATLSSTKSAIKSKSSEQTSSPQQSQRKSIVRRPVSKRASPANRGANSLATPSPKGILATSMLGSGSHSRVKPVVSVSFSPEVTVHHSTPSRLGPTNLSIDLSTVSEASSSQNSSTMSTRDLGNISAEFDAMETSLTHLSPHRKSSLRRSQAASSSSSTQPDHTAATQTSASTQPCAKKAHLSVFDLPDDLATRPPRRTANSTHSPLQSDASDLSAVGAPRNKTGKRAKSQSSPARRPKAKASKQSKQAASQWMQQHADELEAQRQLLDDIDDFELAIA
eukprot:m.15200 g.15200  ORF g.15200 m.15200 type:complete len:384 (+) comp10432_c0_seq1:116-1267(+)